MVSIKRRKGYRTVALGKKILSEQGYVYANLEKSGKFRKDKDLFGLWDCLFIKDKTHLFIQFKTNMPESKKKTNEWKKPFIEWGKQHSSKYVKYQIWNYINRKGFSITECE